MEILAPTPALAEPQAVRPAPHDPTTRHSSEDKHPTLHDCPPGNLVPSTSSFGKRGKKAATGLGFERFLAKERKDIFAPQPLSAPTLWSPHLSIVGSDNGSCLGSFVVKVTGALEHNGE